MNARDDLIERLDMDVCSCSGCIADFILELIREAREEGWDEGQANGWTYGPEATNPNAENPYRADAEEDA